jgi:hypothetical protein
MEGRIFSYYAVLYLLAVLCPLVPAILIYKLFPDTKVSVTGPLSGLTLRAGGAFAAYVTTFLLSMLIVTHFRNFLDSLLGTQVWTVTGKVVLLDENGKPITDQELLNGVTIEYFPNPTEQKFGQLKLVVPVDKKWPTIHVALPKLGSADLDHPFKEFEPREDEKTHTIDFNKPVQIKLNRSEYKIRGTNGDSP